MAKLAEKRKLTDRYLKSLPPAEPGRRPIYWDSSLPGFCVRITDKGRKSFYVGKRPRGATQLLWTLIGHYPDITPDDARGKAHQVLKLLNEGKRPAEEFTRQREAAREAKRLAAANSFGALAELYIKRKLPALRSRVQTEQIIRQRLIVAWGERPLAELKRRDVVELLERVIDSRRVLPGTRRVAEGGVEAARRVLSTASAVFSYAVGRDRIEVNPCSRVDKKAIFGEPVKRERVLDDRELQLLWAAAAAEGVAAYGILIKALLLSGQRLREIAEMRWSEIDLAQRMLVIPKERMKAKREHKVPLSDRLVDLLETLPRFHGKADYVFTLNGSKPISSFDRLKLRLDRHITEHNGAAIPLWTLHDLRRTARTGLSRTGTAPFIAELVIAHVQGGVHATYDKYTYDGDKRSALLRWEQLLLSIVEPPPSNVVPLRRA
jgi:integrase